MQPVGAGVGKVLRSQLESLQLRQGEEPIVDLLIEAVGRAEPETGHDLAEPRLLVIVIDNASRVVLRATILRIAACEPAITHASPSQSAFSPAMANQPITVRERRKIAHPLQASIRRRPKRIRSLPVAAA